jgi:ABC-type transport system involved in multi-copper enzyme maturation permease subunit
MAFRNLLKESLKLYFSSKWAYLLILFLIVAFLLLFFLGEESTHTINTNTMFTLGFLYAPVFLILVPAVLIASEAGSGFQELVLSSPVSELEYFLSRLPLSIIVGLIYLATLLPFSAIYFGLIGISFLSFFLDYLVASILLILFISGLGTMLSALAESKPTTSLSASLMLAFSFVILALYGNYPNYWLKILARISPIVSISDFFGLPDFTSSVVIRPVSIAVLAISTILFILVGYLVFVGLKGKKKPLAIGLAIVAIAAPLLATAWNQEIELSEGEERPNTSQFLMILPSSSEVNVTELWEEKGNVSGLLPEEFRFEPGEREARVRVFVTCYFWGEGVGLGLTVNLTLTSVGDRLTFDGETSKTLTVNLTTSKAGDKKYTWAEFETVIKIRELGMNIKGKYGVKVELQLNISGDSISEVITVIPYSYTDHFSTYTIIAFLPTLAVLFLPPLLRRRRKGLKSR